MGRFRYVIAAMIFGSTLSIYIGRINLSTAIVKMALPIEKKNSTHNATDVCYENEEKPVNPFANYTISTTPAPPKPSSDAKQFEWDQKMQGIILGAFFWGYFLLQVPGGRLAETFGPRILCSIGILGTGIINLVTPLLASNDYAFIGSRVVLGVIQALVFPCCFTLASKWIPDNERSTVLALTSIGGGIGSIIASSMAGYLCDHGFAGGWPSVFYVSGVICCLFSVITFVLLRNSPDEHPWLSTEEYFYIQDNIEALKHVVEKEDGETEPFPWRGVLTCRAVWGQVCVKVTMTWFYSLGILKIPDYMTSVLRLSLSKNGLFSSIIFVAFSASHLVGGMMADFIINRKLIKNRTTIRKLFESIATFGSSALIFVIPLVGCNATMFLVVVCLSQIVFGMQAGGEIPIPSDMSSKYSATLFGIANMCGMMTGFIGPYVVGAFIDADPDHVRQQWRYIFFFTAALNICGGIIFLILGSAQPQDFGEKKFDRKEKKKELEN